MYVILFCTSRLHIIYFKNDTNELIYKTETALQIYIQTCGYQRGNVRGVKDELRA